eukprot:900564-Pleurochrysis_carterae.AAC.2
MVHRKHAAFQSTPMSRSNKCDYAYVYATYSYSSSETQLKLFSILRLGRGLTMNVEIGFVLMHWDLHWSKQSVGPLDMPQDGKYFSGMLLFAMKHKDYPCNVIQRALRSAEEKRNAIRTRLWVGDHVTSASHVAPPPVTSTSTSTISTEHCALVNSAVEH